MIFRLLLAVLFGPRWLRRPITFDGPANYPATGPES